MNRTILCQQSGKTVLPRWEGEEREGMEEAESTNPKELKNEQIPTLFNSILQWKHKRTQRELCNITEAKYHWANNKRPDLT